MGAGPAGRPYEPGGWELFAPLFPLFDSGDCEEGADRAQAIIADDPPYGAVYYVELAPSLAELIRDDEDFAPLREYPAFAEIIGD